MPYRYPIRSKTSVRRQRALNVHVRRAAFLVLTPLKHGLSPYSLIVIQMSEIPNTCSKTSSLSNSIPIARRDRSWDRSTSHPIHSYWLPLGVHPVLRTTQGQRTGKQLISRGIACMVSTRQLSR